MSWQGVVKVKRNGQNPCAYVYDEHRQHSCLFAASQEKINSLFPTEEPSAYWNVTWPHNAPPEFLSIAEGQDW